MKGPFILSETERRIRIEATDPAIDAWVSANAGSGKTTLLGNRVIRLLLAGTEPDRILCLTFTKAAAAEMQARVFRDLASWVRLDDEALEKAIIALGGEAEGRIEPARLARARTLFARAIETPGGLKIQTIHAFAERVLHLVPIEARVPIGFSVLDEADAAILVARARTEAIEAALSPPESGLTLAFREIVAAGGMEGFGKALDHALALLGRLAQSGRSLPPPGERLARYRAALGVPAEETMARIHAALDPALMPPALLREAAVAIRALKAPSDTQVRLAEAFDQASRLAPGTEAFREASLALFLTGDMVPHKNGRFVKDVRLARPDLDEAAKAAALACQAFVARRRAFRAVQRSLALTAFAEDVRTRYDLAKRAGSLLDFDDMIGALRRLLMAGHAAWLRMKLDAAIEHVLVDEAQDTTPEMWDIIRALTEEFFAGEGLARRRRTIFVVGDEKQSIYSFQGADPRAFEDARGHFARLAPAGSRVARPIPLVSSFRSAATLLAGVDSVFAGEIGGFGLGANAGLVGHVAARVEAPGLVELWPSVKAAGRSGNPSGLATRIAEMISGWLSSGARHEADGAPIRAGDILILVQRRGPLSNTLLRELKRRKVPVAGVDRLKIQDELAVRDLLVIGEAMLLEAHDLALATALKTPIFNLADADLERIGRNRAGSLREALMERAPALGLGAIAAGVARLAVAARTESAFGFLAMLLNAPAPGMSGLTGRQAMLLRLGVDAGEPLDALLGAAHAFSTREPGSLLAFIEEQRRRQTVIKRDLEQGGDEVRVMTVHGAKGLEARIVILADAQDKPSSGKEAGAFEIRSEDGSPVLVWAGTKKEEPAAMAAARQAQRRATLAEYRRLLYVAMTRACDRLYVTAHGNFKQADDPIEFNWHALVADGLGRHDETETLPGAEDDAPILRLATRGRTTPPAMAATPVAAPARVPDWLSRPPAPEPGPEAAIRPSRALGDAVPGEERARRRGIILHRLVEVLAPVPAAQRGETGMAALARLAPDLREAEASALLTPLLALFERPEAARLLGPDSRAEVAIAGALSLPDGTRRAVSGRIDRLGITPGRIDLADIKTGRPMLTPGIVAQLALYRGVLASLHADRPIACHVIWLANGTIETLSEAALDGALAALTQA